MYFDKEAQAALQTIRNLQQKVTSTATTTSTPQENNNDSNNNNNNNSEEDSSSYNSEESLSLFYNEAFINTDRSEDQATLTLIGYKGGDLQDQINQDRSFVISPFYIFDNNNSDNNVNDGGNTITSIDDDENDVGVDVDVVNSAAAIGPMRLLGVFDGHAKLGEKVSEYSVRELPQLLSSKLESILSSSSTLSTTNEQQELQIQNAINDTFIEIDKTAPAQLSGGCTASIVLQIEKQIYVANAGDSRSFIATYNRNTEQTSIVYITREDKPDIPEERQRVEDAGGQVYIPPPDRVGASSRVVYVDKITGSRNGLAMSRSIGDWAAGEKGVIPNPTVKVLNIEELIKGATVDDGNGSQECDANYDNDVGEEKKENCHGRLGSINSDVEVFAVSATDGLLDYSDVEDIAKAVAMSLYVDDAPHPLSACESLITTAASLWWQAKNGRYRDDIAIAVSKLSLS